MAATTEAILDRVLRRVEKPARYVGGESNQIVKDPAGLGASIALAFPDVYDVGMSYHGFKILYEIINRNPRWAAERVFAPWPDMEAEMRAAELKLYALESRRPLGEFDLIGFTLQHELSYTNILNMIDLAGFPVESKDRPEAFPLLVGGGEGALAPEPMAPFLDLFVLGDGEDLLARLMTLVEAFRLSGPRPKIELLAEAARVPGVYVPCFHEIEYNEDGTMKRLRPIGESAKPDPADDESVREVPAPVFKRAIFDLRRETAPARPIVPNMRVVQDRFVVEIRRGCSRGCRFCSAGMTGRPVRERSPEQILEMALEGLHNTGFDEVSLLSLSSADHSKILPTVRLLSEAFQSRGVSISLPSLRVNAFDVALADEIVQVRKSGFTFAPEAGSERLRRVINKPVHQETFLQIVDEVCARGWKTLKFYFMIGLPTETDEDLDGIVDLVREAERVGRRRWGNALQINVGLSPFVPKPHTPFQWAEQASLEEIERRHRFVAGRLRGKRIAIKGHDARASRVEGVLARGERRMAAAIRRAWELGAKFDGWGEHFRFDIWEEAFRQTGIDPDFYACRRRNDDEVFPWDHVHAGPGRVYLLREWRAALSASLVADATPSDESDQSDKSDESGKGDKERKPDERTPRSSRKPPVSPLSLHPPLLRMRFRYSRLGGLKYLSHLDVMKIVQMALLRAEIPVSYTEGFNPKPRMRFLQPLPLGFETEDDAFDIALIQRMPPAEALARLNAALPAGMQTHGAEEIPLSESAPDVCLVDSDFLARIPADLAAREGLEPRKVAGNLEEFRLVKQFMIEKQTAEGRPRKTLDLKRTVTHLAPETWDEAGGLSVVLTVDYRNGVYLDPISCLNAILCIETSFAAGAECRRLAVRLRPIPASPSRSIS